MVIVLYNLIEPVVLASIIITAMELMQMGTMVYLVISMAMLLPLLLTQSLSFIQTKQYLTTFMIGFAICVIYMKVWIYCQFTDTPHVNSNPTLQHGLGIWPGQWTKTFLNDLLVLLFASLLLWHYWS